MSLMRSFLCNRGFLQIWNRSLRCIRIYFIFLLDFYVLLTVALIFFYGHLVNNVNKSAIYNIFRAQISYNIEKLEL